MMHPYSPFGKNSEARMCEQRLIMDSETPDSTPESVTPMSAQEIAKLQSKVESQADVIREQEARIKKLEALMKRGVTPTDCGEGCVRTPELEKRPAANTPTGYDAYLRQQGLYAMYGYPYAARGSVRLTRSHYGVPVYVSRQPRYQPREGTTRTHHYADREPKYTRERFVDGRWQIETQLSGADLRYEQEVRNEQYRMQRMHDAAEAHVNQRRLQELRRNGPGHLYKERYGPSYGRSWPKPQDAHFVSAMYQNRNNFVYGDSQSMYFDHTRPQQRFSDNPMVQAHIEGMGGAGYMRTLGQLNEGYANELEDNLKAKFDHLRGDPRADHYFKLFDKYQSTRWISDPEHRYADLADIRSGLEYIDMGRNQIAQLGEVREVDIKKKVNVPIGGEYFHQLNIKTPPDKYGREGSIMLNPGKIQLFESARGVDCAKENGIFFKVDRYSNGKIRGIEIQFTKPGTYLVKGNRITVREDGQTLTGTMTLTDSIRKAPSVGPLMSGRWGEPKTLYILEGMPGQKGKTTEIEVSTIKKGGMRISNDKNYSVYRNENGELRLVAHTSGVFQVRGRYEGGTRQDSLGVFRVKDNQTTSVPELPEEAAAREDVRLAEEGAKTARQAAADSAMLDSLIQESPSNDSKTEDDSTILDNFINETQTKEAPPPPAAA